MKKQWQAVLVFFGRLTVFLYSRLRIYSTWSKIYQFLYERKTRMPLKRFPGLAELVFYVRELKWRADSWLELGDAVSHPEAVQWRAENVPSKFIGDCDEFGIYQAAVIQNELMHKPDWGHLGMVKADTLSVLWYKTGGESWEGNYLGFGGHNVCLIKYKDGRYAYMDYSFPSVKCSTIAEVAELVRKNYAQEYISLGHVQSDVKMKFLSSSWK